MNYKLFLIGLFAVFGSYLIMSLPFVSAVNVKIFYGTSLLTSVSYNPQDLVKRVFGFEGNTVLINITSATGSVSIEKVYIYKCKDKNPSECIQTTPDVFESDANKAYDWSEIANQTSQKGCLMIIVKILTNDKIVWTGFWENIEKNNGFNRYEYPLDEVDVYVKDTEKASLVRNFIESFKVIPFSSEWVTRVVFPTASILYEAGGNEQEIENQEFVSKTETGNQETGIDKDYYFIFPGFSSQGITGVMNPAVFYLNPLYTCDNQDCEEELGERQAACGCFDCGCLSGQYCDIEYGCRVLDMIKLSLVSTPNTKISNCYEEHIIVVPVKIINPPTGLSVVKEKASLGGKDYEISCEKSSETYVCNVTVPPVPNCDEGTYEVGPNRIMFKIRFNNAHETIEKDISVEFPNITIGSFECGNNQCETELGESSVTCCYDCGCSDGYCDAVPSDTEGYCRQDLGNENLRIVNVNPTHFYTFNPGDLISFGAEITERPKSLSVSNWECSLTCSVEGNSCSGSCSVSCNEEPGSENTYNATCTLSVNIDGYDSLKSYTVYPVLNVTAKYVNGSKGSVTKELSKAFPAISYGAHWCGDNKCDPDESSDSCCYDCQCEEGYYCDTQDTEHPSSGDMCKPDFEIVIDKIEPEPLEFVSTFKEHTINITGHITTIPGGLKLDPECKLSDMEIPCYASCEETKKEGGMYYFLCQLTIPSFDYNTSKHYDPVQKKITFAQNSFSLSCSYNNGPSTEIKTFEKNISDIIIDVVYECGSGKCERDLGESAEVCCIDCPCSEVYGEKYFCYTGRKKEGECLSVNEVALQIDEFEHDPYKCIIFERGGECVFSEGDTAYVSVINPPSDIEVVDSYYVIDNGEESDTECFPGEDIGKYACPFVLDNIKNSDEGKESREFNLHLTISYTLDNALFLQNISASKTLSIEREKSKELKTCEEEERKLEKEIESAKKKKNMYITILAFFAALAAGFAICCYVWPKSDKCCILFKVFLVIASCAATYLLNAIGSVQNQIKELKAKKQALCAAKTYDELYDAVNGIGNIWLTLGTVTAGVICALGVSSKIKGVIGASEVEGKEAVKEAAKGGGK